MRGSRFFANAVGAGLLFAQPLAARDDQVVLAASSPWVIDYAEDSCALRRQFGGPETPVVLEMRQFSPGALDYQYKVSSEHFRLNRNYGAQDVAVRYHPDSEFSDAAIAFNLELEGDLKGVTFNHSLFARELDAFYDARRTDDAAAREALVGSFDRAGRAQQVTAIEVRNAFADDVVLQTGALAAPLAAMATCLDELLLHWGIDVESHRTLRQRPQPIDQQIWARRVQQAYPTAMVSRGEQAVLRIRLDVSPEGRVTGCHMQERMGAEQFERTACGILTGSARFSPALDANGNAIASFHILTLIYSINI